MTLSVTYSYFNGQVVKENRNGVERYYAPDTLGSTAQLLDGSGNVTDTYTYWPYGEIRNHTGSTNTPLTFVGTLGYNLDLVANWFYIRARYYQQVIGRWLTVDPLWPAEPAYAYAEASPGSMVDPSGTAPFCKCDFFGVKGVSRSDPHYRCYLQVCLWHQSVCQNVPSEDDCSGWPSCNGLKKSLGPCLPSDPCYGECNRSGGNPTPRGGQPLPDLCCVECQIRVCCHITCPGERNIKTILQRKFKNCVTKGHP